MTDLNETEHPVILFDGVCNLCSSVVQFVIKRDKRDAFRFASLQSSFGETVLRKFDLPADTYNSFILYKYKEGKIFTKSTGALLVAKLLTGAWPLLYSFIIVPAFIRDNVYNTVAKNRYKWFGKKDACWLPSPSLKAKFLD